MIKFNLPDEKFEVLVQRDIEDLAKNIRSIPTFDDMRTMPETFRPSSIDVICARGKRAFNHSGNKRFRALIEDRLEAYEKANSKVQKSVIVSSIVDSIRQASPDAGFVKEEGGKWFAVSDKMAREKIGQSFRDLLHYRYRSSTKAKQQRKEKLWSEMGVRKFRKQKAGAAKELEQLVGAALKPNSSATENGYTQLDSCLYEGNRLKQVESMDSFSVEEGGGIEQQFSEGQNVLATAASQHVEDLTAPEPLLFNCTMHLSSVDFYPLPLRMETISRENHCPSSFFDSQSDELGFGYVGRVSKSIFDDEPLALELLEPFPMSYQGSFKAVDSSHW